VSPSLYLLAAACLTVAGVDETVIEVPAPAVQVAMATDVPAPIAAAPVAVAMDAPEPIRAAPAPQMVIETPRPAAPSVKATPRVVQKPVVISPAPVQGEKPGLLHRLGGILHHHPVQHAQGDCGSNPCGECTGCPQGRLTASGEPPLVESPVVQIGHVESDIRKQYMDKVGHEEDYSWVTGELFYVRSARGQWVVRYATVDTEDRYGGSVVLAAAVNMKNFREGDLVTVHGSILNEGRGSRYLGGPLYRADDISMIERSDP
jgi:hypothetical protein